MSVLSRILWQQWPALTVCLCLAASESLRAQEDTTSADDLLKSAEQWAQENLDENAFSALAGTDEKKARQFFADLEKEFSGPYVLDLAGIRDTARALLPVLESYEETLPYALWLRARLDYLDVAEQLRRSTPGPKTEPGKAPPLVPNPNAQAERDAWRQKLASTRWPKNAERYVKELKPVFAAEKVPPELVWLAEVESSFDPRACSPEGARGLFQLMPATAKRYGLRTWPLDQRVKPETSARAAAQYLRYLHRRFGDWRLALAAYNAGEGTVQKLLNLRKGSTFDTIATRLPAETQMYVPRFEATLMRREGLKLNELRVTNSSQ
jgi:membrane-bound lytic murein transglycosylase D